MVDTYYTANPALTKYKGSPLLIKALTVLVFVVARLLTWRLVKLAADCGFESKNPVLQLNYHFKLKGGRMFLLEYPVAEDGATQPMPQVRQ